MSSEATKLVGFITEQLGREDVDGKKLARLVVAQIVRGNKLGDEIRTVTVPSDGASDEWLEQKAKQIVEHAVEEAVALGAGIQRYAVQAYFGTDDKPRGRHVVVCAGPEEDDAIGSEGPDETGLVAMAMRQAQFFATLASKSTLYQLKNQGEEIEALREENETLRLERLKSFKIMEEIYGQQAEHAASVRRENAKAKIFEDSAEKLQLLIPLAINHMAGKKLLPEHAGSLLLMKAWVDSINPDEFARLSAALGPEKMAAFVQLATSVSKAKPEETAIVTSPANGAGGAHA